MLPLCPRCIPIRCTGQGTGPESVEVLMISSTASTGKGMVFPKVGGSCRLPGGVRPAQANTCCTSFDKPGCMACRVDGRMMRPSSWRLSVRPLRRLASGGSSRCARV